MWIRLILLGLLIFLLVRAISGYLSGDNKKKNDTNIRNNGKKKNFPEDVGEYVDYEEVDDD
ncbi:MAG TPA: DUF4834 family protein [Bacteroidales bacterium]|nr:DUF4834 family protein [Bacteroidales bacterium]